MRWGVPVLMACLATQVPAMALGEESVAGELPADEPQVRFDTGYRFRFGIAFVSGATLLDDGANVSSAPAVLGLDLRLGVQIDDLFAVMSQFSAAFLDLRASLVSR